jgi:hypothetical protein
MQDEDSDEDEGSQDHYGGGAAVPSKRSAPDGDPGAGSSTGAHYCSPSFEAQMFCLRPKCARCLVKHEVEKSRARARTAKGHTLEGTTSTWSAHWHHH